MGHIKLKGAIEPGVVADVMQFISSRSDRIGYLLVHHADTNGRVWFKDGAMVAAECGKARDHEAIKRILGLTAGTFVFVDDPEVPERTIFEDTTSVLLECYRQLDEAKSSEPEASAVTKPIAELPDIPPPRAPKPDDITDGPTRPPFPTLDMLTAKPPEPHPSVSTTLPASPDIPPPQRSDFDVKIPNAFSAWTPDPLGMAWPETTHSENQPAPPALSPEPGLPQSSPVPRLEFKKTASATPQTAPSQPASRTQGLRAIRILRISLVAAMVILLAMIIVFFLLRTPAHKSAHQPEPADLPPDPTDVAMAISATTSPPVVIPNDVLRVAWPDLRFTGLTKIPGQKGLAIVNDQIIREGDVIEGVTIVSVTRTGLLVQCSGDLRFLPFFISSDIGRRGTGRHPPSSLGQMLRQAFER